MRTRDYRSAALVGLTLALVTAGCSTKAEQKTSSGSGDLKTDVGVTDSEIRLAVMTDMSGPYKGGGLALAAGNELWAKDINAAGGICGRQIVLDMKDTVYKVDVAVPQYDQVATDDLGIVQMGGSHILAALKTKLQTQNVLTVPAGWASGNLDTDQIMLVGQTYDIELLNGLAYAQEAGMISDGDKIGHIYQDAEYGQNALLGSQAYAKEHGLDVVTSAISTTDTDMTATVTKMKSEGVKLLVISTTPAATASIALQNAEQGLGVPMIGNSQAFHPSMLSDPAVTSALTDFYMVSSTAPFGSPGELSEKIAAEYTKASTDAPSVGIPVGYTFGMVWEAVLKQACESGDMTRAGVLAAKKKVTSLDTQGLTGELDFSNDGAPSTRQGYILSVNAATPGGLDVKKDLFESPEAKQYKAPHQ